MPLHAFTITISVADGSRLRRRCLQSRRRREAQVLRVRERARTQTGEDHCPTLQVARVLPRWVKLSILILVIFIQSSFFKVSNHLFNFHFNLFSCRWVGWEALTFQPSRAPSTAARTTSPSLTTPASQGPCQGAGSGTILTAGQVLRSVLHLGHF